MATLSRTHALQVQPQPIASEHARRRRRHRLLKAIIVLTVPFYCVGASALTMIRVQEMLNRAAASPLFLGGLVVFLFLLLIEPFTGAMTNSCAVGAQCAAAGAAEPVSCLTAIGVLAGIITLAVWFL